MAGLVPAIPIVEAQCGRERSKALCSPPPLATACGGGSKKARDLPITDGLFIALQEGHEVVGLLRVRNTAEGHAVSLHLGLGIDQIGAQVFRVP